VATVEKIALALLHNKMPLIVGLEQLYNIPLLLVTTSAFSSIRKCYQSEPDWK